MSTEPTTEETTIRADAIAAVAEALRSAAGEDIANALPHANHFERRACSAVAAVWPFAERFWRDRAAADVAEVPVHEPTGNRRYAENVRADCVRAARGVS